MASLVGQTLGHHRILEQLGGGGMGVVYKAQDLELKRLVALKFLPPSFGTDPDARARFMHEAQTASALDHPNICTIHEIGHTDEGQLFICMAYYEGETLTKRIGRGPLALDEALDIASQVAHGLAKAHDLHIVHRDIKPANIMLTGDGIAKILDFGLAKLAGQTRVTREGSTLGTVAYMSPEQVRAEETDHRTDIWSLGCVLYEMLTGQLPFRGEYEQVIFHQIMNEPLRLPDDLCGNNPPALAGILTRALAKDPAERYQRASELAHDIAALRQRLGQPEPRKPAKRPGWKVLVPAGLAVVAALATGIWLFLLQGGTEGELREKSIAILPFASISRTPEDEVFAEGIHDQLLTQLSGIRDLLVISRQSVRQYKDTPKRTRDIARELDVRMVMEGSVQTVQNTVRMQVQLIDGETEGHLWAKTYTREFKDIFKVQSEIAENVAAALKSTITPEEKILAESAPTANREAFEYYTRGNYYWSISGNIEGNRKAYELYERAAELDPQFAQAFAMSAIVHLGFHLTFWDTSGNHLGRAKKMLETAERLAPDLAETRCARGAFVLQVDQDADRALAEFEAALSVRPNSSELLGWLGQAYVAKRDLDRAEIAHRRSDEIDPLRIFGGMDARQVCRAKREWNKARVLSREYITRHPDDIFGYLEDARLLAEGFGNLDEAQEVLNEGMRLPTPGYRFPENPSLLKEFHARIARYRRNDSAAVRILKQNNLGIPPELVSIAFSDPLRARRYLDSLRIEREREAAANHWVMPDLSMVLAARGEKERALECAEKAVDRVPKADIWMEREQHEEKLLQVCVLVGEHGRALDMVDDMLSKPGFLTTWKLKLDPLYDPLRQFPRFQALLSKYEQRSER